MTGNLDTIRCKERINETTYIYFFINDIVNEHLNIDKRFTDIQQNQIYILI